MTTVDPSRKMDASERLTNAALEAMKAGDWALVSRCYAERELCLAAVPVDRIVAARLLAADEQVKTAAHVAQAALAAQLAESAWTRRHLHRIKTAQGTGDLTARLDFQA
jgi:hypothetical protein